MAYDDYHIQIHVQHDRNGNLTHAATFQNDERWSNNYTRYCFYFEDNLINKPIALLFVNFIDYTICHREFIDVGFFDSEFFGDLANEIYKFVKTLNITGTLCYNITSTPNYVRIMPPYIFKEESKCGRIPFTKGYYMKL